MEFTSGCPSLLIDDEVSKKLESATRKALGSERVIDFEDLPKGGLGGSEDFAYISHEVPSIMLAIAAGEPAKGYEYPLHHPKVMFDDNALTIGSAVYAYTALRWLQEHK